MAKYFCLILCIVLGQKSDFLSDFTPKLTYFNKFLRIKQWTYWLIDWLIYSFVVLTSNMSTPCGSIYWCLYRKTLREKKLLSSHLSLIAFRSSFEALSKLFRRISIWCFFHLLFCYILIYFFSDSYLIRNKNARKLM